ncbi:MAG: ATP-binding protein, partial [Bacteroidetes bacterium]|nr:ATP-binding protein [Bacteroidota bacterium]
MYIGKLGDGSSQDDGIYVLLKEVIDNSVDEYMMGFGRTIEITLTENLVKVRDYGRGVPLGKVVDVASRMNTGAKYDSKVFKKTVGLNGVGIKAVNALSEHFIIQSYREGEVKGAIFCCGDVITEEDRKPTSLTNGTEIVFRPDEGVFGNYRYVMDYVEAMVRNYVYLNTGLTIILNGRR